MMRVCEARGPKRFASHLLHVLRALLPDEVVRDVSKVYLTHLRFGRFVWYGLLSWSALVQSVVTSHDSSEILALKTVVSSRVVTTIQVLGHKRVNWKVWLFLFHVAHRAIVRIHFAIWQLLLSHCRVAPSVNRRHHLAVLSAIWIDSVGTIVFVSDLLSLIQ